MDENSKDLYRHGRCHHRDLGRFNTIIKEGPVRRIVRMGRISAWCQAIAGMFPSCSAGWRVDLGKVHEEDQLLYRYLENLRGHGVNGVQRNHWIFILPPLLTSGLQLRLQTFPANGVAYTIYYQECNITRPYVGNSNAIKGGIDLSYV